MSRRMLIAFLATALTALPVAAHHGWSEYDSDRPLDLAGKIQESGYEHPHGYLKLETREKVWIVVLAPPSRMERRGLARGMLKTGGEVNVVGYPNRSKPDEMRAERITVAGKTVGLR